MAMFSLTCQPGLQLKVTTVPTVLLLLEGTNPFGMSRGGQVTGVKQYLGHVKGQLIAATSEKFKGYVDLHIGNHVSARSVPGMKSVLFELVYVSASE